MATILVTGAGGFIGRALTARLVAEGHQVVGAVRQDGASLPQEVMPAVVGEIGPETDWSAAARGADIVFHLAQRAHRASSDVELASEPVVAARLAEAAARHGAGRFVYVSSIKAMGETTQPGMPFRADDTPRPADPYGRTKLATEQALADTAAKTGLELVILRPPLVYGPGVRANFRALIALARCGLPLPFAAVDNHRSFVFLGNLVDLAVRAATHPGAAGHILLVRDDRDFSTPELLVLLAAATGGSARLWPAPRSALAALTTLPAIGTRLLPLLTSLQVDDEATRAALDWSPPMPAAQALAETARAVLRS